MSPEQSQAKPIDGRSDLFSVGTLLYLLTTGRKPFDGLTDSDVIMAGPARQAREAVDDRPRLEPDVERVINRALRADPAKRWQSAEQMADRIDAILVKLGQPSGPAPLMRWLETLSARDGAKPPVADEAATDPSIAVNLGSLDLELEDVAPTYVEEDRGTGVDTRHLGPIPGAEADVHNLSTRALPPISSFTIAGRFRRWVVRMSIGAALTLATLGGGFYLLRSHSRPGRRSRSIGCCDDYMCQSGRGRARISAGAGSTI
jgi:serine/threonine protein kinase